MSNNEFEMSAEMKQKLEEAKPVIQQIMKKQRRVQDPVAAKIPDFKY